MLCQYLICICGTQEEASKLSSFLEHYKYNKHTCRVIYELTHYLVPKVELTCNNRFVVEFVVDINTINAKVLLLS